MSPWDCPFLLTPDPLADDIAAENTAIVKPGAYSPASSAVTEHIITECFAPNYIAVVTGGREENASLPEKKAPPGNPNFFPFRKRIQRLLP